MELTKTGKPKDGFYYPIICNKHGETQGVCIGKFLICCMEDCKE